MAGLKPAGIDALDLVLDATRTPFIERLGAPVDDPAFNGCWPDDVASAGLKNLGKGPTSTMPNASGIVEELSKLDRTYLRHCG